MFSILDLYAFTFIVASSILMLSPDRTIQYFGMIVFLIHLALYMSYWGMMILSWISTLWNNRKNGNE